MHACVHAPHFTAKHIASRSVRPAITQSQTWGRSSIQPPKLVCLRGSVVFAGTRRNGFNGLRGCVRMYYYCSRFFKRERNKRFPLSDLPLVTIGILSQSIPFCLQCRPAEWRPLKFSNTFVGLETNLETQIHLHSFFLHNLNLNPIFHF